MSDLFKKRGIRQSHSVGPYNKSNDTEQWIRISQGCPNNCPFCYEPPKEEIFPVPFIIRNRVKIMDMNLLSKSKALKIIQDLGERRVDNRVVYYELVCGIDYRYLTSEIATALRDSRFGNIRIAWDFGFVDQYKIRDAIELLKAAGYKKKTIMVFMICNWQTPFKECFKKLYLCAVWNVRVSDCYFDGQTSPNIQPIGWTQYEIKTFRSQVRKHNQLITFGIDPEIKRNPRQKRMFDQ
ncbi:hypothetical protein LCGC14_2464730 [marine sediment metagenome]|uniref:Radical SAM core domain-containing protein n=1 Tax=marine sediment metagenome TaxID=412755 RepID=A0A0F9DPD0_9ZZZZ